MGHVWLDKKDWLLSPRGRLIVGGLTLGILVLLLVPRSPTRIEARFVVEPAARAVIHATHDGVVAEVLEDEGTRVEAGQPLLRLTSTDLEASLVGASSDLMLARRQAAAAHREGDPVTAAKRNREMAEARERLRTLNELDYELVATAPMDGVISTMDPRQLVGRYVTEGEPLMAVDRLDVVRLAVATAESDVAEIEPGVEVRMLARALPGRTLRARVLDLAPVALEPQLDEEAALDLVQRVNLVRVIVEIENAEGLLRPGMSGRVQFLTADRSMLGKRLWRFRRWAELVVW